MKLWLSLIMWLTAGAATAQVGIFDCNLPSGSKTFAFKSTNGMVEVIRPETDVKKLTVEEKSLTDEGKTVVVTKWPNTQKIISVASITPQKDSAGKITSLDFSTLTVSDGRTINFRCSLNTSMQLVLDRGLNELIEQLSALPNPEDVIAEAVRPIKSIKRFDKDGAAKGIAASIAKCWNIGSLSTDALRVSLVVSFTVDARLKPNVATIRLEVSENGNALAVQEAFDAARRAIIRCGARGYGDGLAEKFGALSAMEPLPIKIMFNAEKMRIVLVEKGE